MPDSPVTHDAYQWITNITSDNVLDTGAAQDNRSDHLGPGVIAVISIISVLGMAVQIYEAWKYRGKRWRSAAAEAVHLISIKTQFQYQPRTYPTTGFKHQISKRLLSSTWNYIGFMSKYQGSWGLQTSFQWGVVEALDLQEQIYSISEIYSQTMDLEYVKEYRGYMVIDWSDPLVVSYRF
ncbi:hypothetical protein BJV82DRAFT_656348 [Fennellomyces sp. T-0311]|nr:hypothetical protein BJV82DRAFT_656348 [Fennellomyces sp. T-0311]